MLYSKHLVVAANTTEANAESKSFIANKGVIYRVWITFPTGCAGLVKVRILHEGHPFVPINADDYISCDGFIFEYPVMYEIHEAPEQITIQAWNDDDTYQHQVDVQVLIIPKEWVQPAGASEGIIAALASIFKRR